MTSLVCLVLLSMSSVQAMPLLNERQNIARRDETTSSSAGEPATDRTIFIMLALTSIGLMCFLLGLRFSKLRRSIFMKRNVMSTLVLIIFVQIFMFITLSTVLVAGQGMYNYELCKAATWVCLIGYTFTKFMIFLFLVERVHVVRAPFMTRRKDKIYLGCLAMVLVSFGPLVINSYVDPLISIDESGRCRAGIRQLATIPTIVVNSIVDMILTGVFFYLLRPVVKIRWLPAVSHMLRSRRNNKDAPLQAATNETSAQRSIRTLLWKSIIGSLLIELPMIANMIQMAITKGDELGMICLTICMVEVVWDALVIYWLAFGSSARAEKDLQRSAMVSSKATLVQTPASGRSRKGSIEGDKAFAAHIEKGSSRICERDVESVKRIPSGGSGGDAISLALPQKCADRI